MSASVDIPGKILEIMEIIDVSLSASDGAEASLGGEVSVF